VTIREAADALRAHRVSASDLTASALTRIERLNPASNAFLSVTVDRARERARQADAELANGRDRGPLHGIPIALKDIMHMRGIPTTGGSKLNAGLVPESDATVVERLESAGAVIVGKTNLHEFAYGITSANPHFGAVRNPWDAERSPGGSSGGSGAAVAAGLIYGALGTDTGGSIRIPAAFCGVVGLKPTYGRVSRHGVLPLAWSLDHVGPLARSVRDAALMFNAIAGFDPRDETSSRHPTVDFVPDEDCSIRGLRIGFPENFYFEHLDSSVESAVRGAIARAASLGAVIRPIRVPDMDALNTIGRMVQIAEASAALEPYMDRRESIGADVVALLDQGRLIAATDYIQAQRLRRQFQRDFERLWTEVDCLIAPTTPMTAPRIGETSVRLGGSDHEVRLAATRLVRGVNVLGIPALSLPCGLSGSGMPIGLQIIGAAMQEALILRVGAALEDSGVGIPPCPEE
jgi:aspartyl-tRNA(Asn)/glutamyl-tRNA(Gln) amidotransferase subunit A